MKQRTARPPPQPELFDTTDAFCLVSEEGQDGHALLDEKIAKAEAAEAMKRNQVQFQFGN